MPLNVINAGKKRFSLLISHNTVNRHALSQRMPMTNEDRKRWSANKKIVMGSITGQIISSDFVPPFCGENGLD
jgi:hypothetical protein